MIYIFRCGINRTVCDLFARARVCAVCVCMHAQMGWYISKIVNRQFILPMNESSSHANDDGNHRFFIPYIFFPLANVFRHVLIYCYDEQNVSERQKNEMWISYSYKYVGIYMKFVCNIAILSFIRIFFSRYIWFTVWNECAHSVNTSHGYKL